MKTYKFNPGTKASKIVRALRQRWSLPRRLAKQHKVSLQYVLTTISRARANGEKLEIKHIHRATPGKPRYAYRIG